MTAVGWIPAFAGMTAVGWISAPVPDSDPGFAGMTKLLVLNSYVKVSSFFLDMAILIETFIFAFRGI